MNTPTTYDCGSALTILSSLCEHHPRFLDWWNAQTFDNQQAMVETVAATVHDKVTPICSMGIKEERDAYRSTLRDVAILVTGLPTDLACKQVAEDVNAVLEKFNPME